MTVFFTLDGVSPNCDMTVGATPCFPNATMTCRTHAILNRLSIDKGLTGSTMRAGTISRRWVACLAMPGCAVALMGAAPAGGPITLPFDFSKSAIEIDVTVKSKSLHMILDTGVDPSVIDLAEVEALGIPVNRGDSGRPAALATARARQCFRSRSMASPWRGMAWLRSMPWQPICGHFGGAWPKAGRRAGL
jgi:hypothetical protein